MERYYTPGGTLKAMARECLLGNYKSAVTVQLLLSIITTAALTISSTIIKPDNNTGMILYTATSVIMQLLLTVFSLGLCCFYLNLISGQKAGIKDLFFGFSGFADRAIGVRLLSVVSSMISFIPALIAAIWYNYNPGNDSLSVLAVTIMAGFILMLYVLMGYSQVLYIILDFPELNVFQVMARSNLIMRGKRIKYLALLLSFIPYYLLGLFSMGIAYLWITPYINATKAEFYLDIA